MIDRVDLDHILSAAKIEFLELKDKTLFITGGTGFLGKWLVEALLYANDQLNLDCQLILLSRNPNNFKREFPHLGNHPAIKMVEGDISTFSFPESPIDIIIHAAADADSSLHSTNSMQTFNSIVDGTKRVIECAKSKNVQMILHFSSGAVYGKMPANIERFSEDYMGAPDCLNPSSSYGEGKRVAEFLLSIFGRESNCLIKIARLFSFIGPYMPLNGSFAAGNFIRDALHDKHIKIQGDGTPLRSFLYAGDFVIWCMKLLVRGESLRPYNIGAEQAYSIADLAQQVANQFEECKISIAKKADSSAPKISYLPNVSRTMAELGVEQTVSLENGIKKVIKFIGSYEKN